MFRCVGTRPFTSPSHSYLHLRKNFNFLSSTTTTTTTLSSTCSYSTSSSSSSSSNDQLKHGTTYDAAVIGAGHNGLVTAAYLAKAGLKVVVLERRDIVGGAAVTEEIFPGFKFSRCSYLNSLFRPHIVRDLELTKYGYEILPRVPSSFTPVKDGRYLMLGPDESFNRDQVAKFSKKDADNLARYEHTLSRMAAVIEPLLDSAPFNPSNFPKDDPTLFVKNLFSKAPQLKKYLSMGLGLGRDLPNFFEVMTSPAKKILERWFESEPLISTLATDAVIGAMIAPSTPSSGYVLFHHVMGDIGLGRGVWAYMRGGMGAISNAIALSAKRHGAVILTGKPVKQILTRGDEASGILLEDGTVINAKTIVSNATPHVTFNKLLDSNILPKDFSDHVKSIDYTSPVTKINLAVNKLPNFKILPNSASQEPGPQHRGTIHFVETSSEIEDAYLDAVRGMPSKRPVIEMTIPSSLDNTVAPPGQHVVQLFVQYTPYKPADGSSWEDPAVKEKFADRVFNVIEEHCPGFKESIVGKDILTPVDLERIFGLTGGNIFHGAMGLDQLFWLRPVPGFTDYRSPVRNLYMCGSGTHPGGGVMGAAGHNASQVILEDFKARK